MNKQSNRKFFIGLTVALLLPLSFYIIAKMLGKDKLPMARYFNVERIDSNLEGGKVQYDTIFHKAADLVLYNQTGDQVSLNKDLEGKILIVNVFFTQCRSICPTLTGNMRILQKAFRKNDTSVHLISITVDPENDSVQVLRQYADLYHVNHDHWWLLTGNRTTIYHYLRDELKLMVKPSGSGAEELDHTPTIVLLDKDRFVRGYYNGLDTAALRTCADDIGLLSMQKKRKKKE